jgi:hypothetical protein
MARAEGSVNYIKFWSRKLPRAGSISKGVVVWGREMWLNVGW